MTVIAATGALPSISTLGSANTLSVANTTARAPVTIISANPPASTSVSLNQAASASNVLVYTPEGTVTPSGVAVWERDATDAISEVMSRNTLSRTWGGAFDDVGAALLNRFAASGSNFSQSVLFPRTEAQTQGVSNLALQTQLHMQADNAVSLRITTASGVKVDITLGRSAEGMAAQINVEDGTLTETERNAIASLSGAFQDALDGLAEVPPRLAIAGLSKVDPSVLSSVNLRATSQTNGVASQTIEFQSDSKQRSITITGPSGVAKVDVDVTQPNTFGSAAQQAAAVSKYLQQFDSARRRGNGDEALVDLFKGAFSALHSSYGPAAAPVSEGIGQTVRASATDLSRSMLSGLADFSASVSQTAQKINPLRQDEIDGFSYQVSQDSSVSGSTRWDMSVTQVQKSALAASFHKSLVPNVALDLTKEKESQNYQYFQINDTTSSQTDIRYERGELAKATFSQSSNLSTQVTKFLLGKEVEKTFMPSSDTSTRDMLSLVRAARLDESTKDIVEPRDQVNEILRRRLEELASSVADLRNR
ncbi:hypothetical protein RAS12_27445 [Achromobacter seleniivolatilans]|uniref:Lactate dehydrogenase n=1 Tax=Achromobacter seleniivolatilans TaxID=3047478 RepID=A0ABY9M148_9BURK|nr:hypothetical protein [Achromobacter sp. R39]WMD20299.1 hypothetical protein RAS12_27445 [Achromobacter sp. R39]